MTAQEFETLMGRAPADDDLERANCSQVGQIGHITCGWCLLHDAPAWECLCHMARNRTERLYEDRLDVLAIEAARRCGLGDV